MESSQGGHTMNMEDPTTLHTQHEYDTFIRKMLPLGRLNANKKYLRLNRNEETHPPKMHDDDNHKLRRFPAPCRKPDCDTTTDEDNTLKSKRTIIPCTKPDCEKSSDMQQKQKRSVSRLYVERELKIKLKRSTFYLHPLRHVSGESIIIGLSIVYFLLLVSDGMSLIRRIGNAFLFDVHDDIAKC